MKLLKTKISFLLSLLSNTPKIYWWFYIDEKGNAKQNFGDYLNPYLIEKMTGKKPVLFFPNSKLSRYVKHSVMIGSVISKANATTLVWGSGIIKKNDKIKGGNFLAVRGPRTAKRLEELGLKAPKVFGDPALLVPLYYKKSCPVQYKIGVIPHFFNYESINKLGGDTENILIINLLSGDIEGTLDQMLSCEKIISTSLHGVILAHAYGIPAVWWKYSELNGDDVKFYDYFESVGLTIPSDFKDKTLEEMIQMEAYYLPDANQIQKRQKELLDVFPYKLKSTKTV